MSENTSITVVLVVLIAAAVALVVTGHGGWVIATLIFLFLFIGG